MLTVLWVTNVEVPEASAIQGRAPSPFGGWLDLASRKLAELEGVSLFVAFPKGRYSSPPVEFKGARITYLPFDSTVNQSAEGSLPDRLARVIEHVDPDIVHIFGTEFEHAHIVINLCVAQDRKFVVSIQGLMSVYARHYATGLPFRVQFRSTIRDLVKRDNIHQQHKNFYVRGVREIDALRKTKHAIGRTSWDHACLAQINHETQYHYCNEILRTEFYGPKWRVDRCDRYTIFVSQGNYPIKGLHLLIEAMPLVLEQFPQARVFVGGWPISIEGSLRSKMRETSYAAYIRQLVRKHRLDGKLVFTGLLSADQVRDQLLRTHVFVLPSTIENSPNSLGEAMLLGVPCVASRVGGVADLLEDGREGHTYQVDAPYMLAHYICKLFGDDEGAARLSAASRKRAWRTHNSDRNTHALEHIYTSICEGPPSLDGEQPLHP